MEKIQELFSYQPVRTILVVVAGLVVIHVLTGLLKSFVSKYTSETDKRYRLRKTVNYLRFVLYFFFIVFIFRHQLPGLSVFFGITGAGLAFALQEVIASIAGFIAINFSNFYKVGDRVMLGGIKGDVVDIGVLRTSLMQIGDWVDGDLYNGKIVRIANSFVFKEPVFNYSGDFPFLWDEIQIPLKTKSDYQYAFDEFYKILSEVQGDYAQRAQKKWNEMTEKLMVENAQVMPMVSMRFDQNWITFSLRYVVNYKKRRMTKDNIYKRILDLIRDSDGKIAVASAALEITAFPDNRSN